MTLFQGYFKDCQYSGAIKACKKIPFPNPIILQTKWFVKFMNYLNCNAFLETAVNFSNI